MEGGDLTEYSDKNKGPVTLFSKTCAIAAGIGVPVGVFLAYISKDQSLGYLIASAGTTIAAIGAANVHFEQGTKVK